MFRSLKFVLFLSMFATMSYASDLTQFLEQKNSGTKEFEKMNFEKEDFVGNELPGCSFKECNFKDAILDECDLREASFDQCSMMGASFQNANLEKAKFSGNSLNKVNFNGANLKNAEFSFESIDGSKFEHCQLNEAIFANGDQATNLRGCRFNHATLEKSTFKEAYFNGGELDNINAENATFVKLSLWQTSAKFANFTNAKLRFCSIREDGLPESLTGACFKNADLRKSQLSVKSLVDVSFLGANLESSDLGDINGVDLSKTDLRNANLEDVQLFKDPGPLLAEGAVVKGMTLYGNGGNKFEVKIKKQK